MKPEQIAAIITALRSQPNNAQPALDHPASPAPADFGQNIVVLDRGFVYVGDVTQEGDFLRVKNAKNIRYWGTKNGLGELREGPLKETKLDAVGEILAPLRALIHLVPCKGF
tara:strand:+ start:948 stop:1283 length:336 start_codon:yes stop_codon:yes gene_type:complete